MQAVLLSSSLGDDPIIYSSASLPSTSAEVATRISVRRVPEREGPFPGNGELHMDGRTATEFIRSKISNCGGMHVCTYRKARNEGWLSG